MIRFDVDGIPRPAGSKRAFAFVRKGADGKPAMRQTKSGKTVPLLGTVVTDDAGEHGQAWRYAVQQSATRAMAVSIDVEDPNVDATETVPINYRPPLDDALEVLIVFRMPRPKCHLRTNGTVKASAPGWPTTKPDCDKLSRAVMDALKGIVWRDDAQVVVKRVVKLYTVGRPGCSVTFQPVDAATELAAAREAATA